MRVFNRIATQPSGILVGMVVAGALMAVTIGLAFAGSRVLASHDDPAVVHTCVSQFTGQARFVAAGQEPNCNGNELLVDLAGGGVLDELAALRSQVDDLAAETDEQAQRIGELEEALDGIDLELPACLTTDGDDVVFEGCNVHVRNGEDRTGTTNGAGNLIVGYNEDPFGDPNDRTGSHNLVVGDNHTYSSFGGFVAGFGNTISGEYASASGGTQNRASGRDSSVSGGVGNDASGSHSSVSGGEQNEASGFRSAVSGGVFNEASGPHSTVSGGRSRTAPGFEDWAAGSLFEDS